MGSLRGEAEGTSRQDSRIRRSAAWLERRLLGETPGRTDQGQPDSIGGEAATWAIRFFLGREPLNKAEIALHSNHSSLESLRTAFASTWEFGEFYDKIKKPPYRIPLALVRPPEDAAVPWRFTEPTLSEPVSQLCTASQFAEPSYTAWCRVLRQTPTQHRKQWEFVWLLACMDRAGLLRSGCRAVGFGVGKEPLAAVLAARGVAAVGSDAPAELVQDAGWATTDQHANRKSDLFLPDIVDRETFDRLVTFREVDMNDIPDDLRDFDVCWSSCALEHLGSLGHGLAFIENSLATLRPGGLALHTTEFNLSSDTETFESPGLSLYRRSDVLGLASRLISQGHEVWPINLHPGTTELDEHIDLPPYTTPHFKLNVARFTTTSIGLAVRKRSS